MNLSLPQFKIEGSQSTSLKNILISLGLTTCFFNQADFSFLDPKNSIFISDVIHKAMIEVNEEGAEASAASAVVM